MAQVEEVIFQALEALDQKVAAVQGVPPRLKPKAIPPPPARQTTSTHYTYLANLIRPLIGFQTLDPGSGLTIEQLQDDIAYGIFFIGEDVYSLAQIAGDALDAAKAYTDAEVRYVSAIQSGQGAAAAAGALAQARAWFNQAEANITTVWNDAYQTAVNAQHTAEAFAQSQVNQEAYVRGVQIEGVSNGLDQKFGQAETDIHSVLAASAASALDAQHSAENYAKSLHDIAESDISTVWTDAYATALDVGHNANVYAEQLVGNLSTTIESKLATDVEPTLARVATEVDTCLAPLCDSVTPNANQLGKLGNLLKGLESIGIAALISGLVAAAVADPEDAARTIEDVAGWTTTAADELVQAVGG